VTEADDREAINEPANPLGMEGIEFIEYATARPQALGQVLETLGFRPIARHRSREVLLYRQGGINVIVNAHGGGAGRRAARWTTSRSSPPWHCGCVTRPRPTGARWSAAPGRCRSAWK
jgi:4-hydroxyphenylpyruvate dioxygenase